MTKRKLNSLWNFIYIHKIVFLGILLLVGVTYFNQLHYPYPDEFENILGGKFIISGRLPYSGFFTHHNPFAYFAAAPVVLLVGTSFVRFRLMWGVVQFVSAIVFAWFINKRFADINLNKIFIIALSFFAVLATFNWGHMLLADSLGGFLMIGAYILLVFLMYREDLTYKDVWIISLLTSCGVLTTMTQVFTSAVIYLFITILAFKNNSRIKWYKVWGIILIPYLIFMGYLLVTGSALDFYKQPIRYNTDYYVKLPDNASFKNPVRVAIVYAFRFWNSYKVALVMAKDFNLGYPFISAMALANAGFIVYLLLTKKYSLAIFAVLALIYSNTRGDPYTTAETDYQALLYHLLSIVNGSILLISLWNELKQEISQNKKAIFSFLLIVHSIYFLFLFMYLFDKWADKSYKKYMGLQATIYDRPSIAPTLNKLLNDNDPYFIGPFDFENQFYMKRKPVTKYIVNLPGMDHSQAIQSDILTDFKNAKPPLVVFGTEMSIFGIQTAQYLKDYLAQNYQTIEQLNSPCIKFEVVNNNFKDYDITRHFFISNERRDEYVNKFIETGLIKLSSNKCSQ